MMGTSNLFMRKTRLDFVSKDPLNQLLHGNMFRGLEFLWVFVFNFMVSVFGSIIKYIIRFEAGKNHEIDKSGNSDQIGSKLCLESQVDVFFETQADFQVQNSEDIDKGNEETENSVTASSVSTNKYEFLSGKHIRGFIEEPKTVSLNVHEGFVGPDNYTVFNNPILDKGVLADNGKLELEAGDVVEGKAENSVENCIIDKVWKKQEVAIEADAVIKEKAEDSVHSFIIEKVLERQEQDIEADAVVKEKAEDSVQSVINEKDLDNQEQEIEVPAVVEEKAEDSVESFSIEKDSEIQEQETFTDHESFEKGELNEFLGKDDVISRSNHIESITYEFSANRDVSEELGPEAESHVVIDGEKVEDIEEIHLPDTSVLDQEAAVTIDQTNDSDDEYIELEPRSQKFIALDEEILSREDSSTVEDKNEHENFVHEEPSLGEIHAISKFDDQDDSEFMLEHHDIIEQLKMELKNVRTGGLSTILEESESPKNLQELKPLKIDEKFENKDHMGEIQKVYKSYFVKMRKLDVLNLQTKHAIDFIQQSATTQLTTTRRSSVPAIMSILSQGLLSCKPQRPEADQPLKRIGELKKDFEMVYVGHLCLSWEILHWQYGKTLELQEYDSQGLRHYNQLAGEFQLFQVLMQRFIEDEPFEDRPRFESYVKNRRVHRDLLQVPVIKDDFLRDKKKRRNGEEEHAISISMLTDMIAESMRLFWEFLCADNVITRGPQQTKVDLRNTVDLELLMEIRTDLQKKDKKLKEIVRSGNCIVKKFQKHQEDRWKRALFISQVELKLISRVLSMSKLTTDHLVWCHAKLDKINFCNRKILIEPSFLLFPC